jgi:Domain of unknown function (DUF3597)
MWLERRPQPTRVRQARSNDKPSDQFVSTIGNIHRRDNMSILGNIMSAIFGTKAEAGELPTGAGSDVAAILDKMAAANPEKLDWKNSIVDLMKLLNLDSSITARKQLAKDLNYTGNTNDSASMNIWLHQQVMQKLAANGGKVPADLLKY